MVIIYCNVVRHVRYDNTISDGLRIMIRCAKSAKSFMKQMCYTIRYFCIVVLDWSLLHNNIISIGFKISTSNNFY